MQWRSHSTGFGMKKALVDLMFSALVPLLVLRLATGPLGAVGAYLLAAAIPVVWCVVDLVFFSKRLSPIILVAATATIGKGLLSLWFIDGWRYALKDSGGMMLLLAICLAAAWRGHPVAASVLTQSLTATGNGNPDLLHRLFRRPGVHTALWLSSWLICGLLLTLIAVNIALNMWFVTASFGTAAFNDQVAAVNGITRLAFSATSIGAMGFILCPVLQALHAELADASDRQWWTVLERLKTLHPEEAIG